MLGELFKKKKKDTNGIVTYIKMCSQDTREQHFTSTYGN